jgi:hypothetical protein
LSDLSLEICLESIAIMGTEGDWCCNIQVVHEIGDMKQDRVSGLPKVSYRGELGTLNLPLSRRRALL